MKAFCYVVLDKSVMKIFIVEMDGQKNRQYKIWYTPDFYSTDIMFVL